MDHYEILGVEKEASLEEIKAAYRRRASEAHPDRAGGDEKLMSQVNKAYETLGNPEARARYDRGEGPAPRELTPEEKANQMIREVLAQVLLSDQLTNNPLETVTIHFNLQLNQGREMILKAKRIIERSKKWKTQVQYQGKEDNLVADVMDHTIKMAQDSIDLNQKQIAILELVIRILDEYSWSQPTPPPPPSTPHPSAYINPNGRFIY